jgi:hypothetical protein
MGDVVSGYFAALDKIVGLISECKDGHNVTSLLKESVCQVGFKRLN